MSLEASVSEPGHMHAVRMAQGLSASREKPAKQLRNVLVRQGSCRVALCPPQQPLPCAMAWLRSPKNPRRKQTCQEGLERVQQGGAVGADALGRALLELGRQQHARCAAGRAEDPAAQPAVVPGPPQ